MYKIKHAGFTLIELLVVIAIIGLLVTLSVLALSNARVASRDAKRVSDVKQMQSALELFFDANNRYPTNSEFQSGSLKSFASTTGTTTYMSVIPAAPTPNDGSCLASNNNYVYSAPADGSTYTLNFCVSKKINDLPAGNLAATPGGIIKGFNCGDSVSYAGESYPTVQIGSQCWMAKNLGIGTMLTGTSTNSTDNGIIEKYCYGDNASNCAIYGGLYQWNEAMQYSTTEKVQGICPSSWHIASDAEQNTLDQYLKDSGQTCDASRNGAWDCATAGTKLKTGGSSGFNDPLAGARSPDGSFYNQGALARFWSSSVSDASARYRGLGAGATVFRNTDSRAYGFSVRCLKN